QGAADDAVGGGAEVVGAGGCGTPALAGGDVTGGRVDECRTRGGPEQHLPLLQVPPPGPLHHQLGVALPVHIALEEGGEQHLGARDVGQVHLPPLIALHREQGDHCVRRHRGEVTHHEQAIGGQVYQHHRVHAGGLPPVRLAGGDVHDHT